MARCREFLALATSLQKRSPFNYIRGTSALLWCVLLLPVFGESVSAAKKVKIGENVPPRIEQLHLREKYAHVKREQNQSSWTAIVKKYRVSRERREK